MDPDPRGPKTCGSGSATLVFEVALYKPQEFSISLLTKFLTSHSQLILVPDISDSFYEILLKSFIMYGDTADVTKFNESYQKETSQN
jgi:hypothetical protein